MFRSIVVLAALAGLVGPAAHAQSTFTVSTQGLNLNVPADAKAFYGRLRRAAAAACGGAPTSFFGTEEDRFQTCYKATVDAGVEQARAPMVAALHGHPRSVTLATR